VIYSELSMAFERIEELEAVVSEASLSLEQIPREALFLAGKAFLSYRRRQGTKQGVLPDFYIGAHAAVSGYALLTRDVSRYRSYFPTVRLIAPP
jgi:predicted nucleic acid-binding protein